MKAPTAALFRQTLSRFATGVSLVTAKNGTLCQGITINSLASVSLDPPLVLFSLKNNSPRYDFFKESKNYAISILSANQQDLSNYFARHSDVTPAPFPLIKNSSLPLFKGALAHLKGSQEVCHEGGDHTIFILRVTALSFDETQKPLLFYESQYRNLA